MPTLTRRRDPDARQESWLIRYGDVRVGCIGLRSGNPAGTDPWQWSCGFYPGSDPGECTSGTTATFESARAAFEAAWAVFLSKRTGADFEEWRRQRDWTARKYAAWARGEKLPTQRPNSVMRCVCGAADYSLVLPDGFRSSRSGTVGMTHSPSDGGGWSSSAAA